MSIRTDRLGVRIRSRVTWPVIALAAFWLAACGSSGKRPATSSIEPDRFLFEQGTAALQDKKWLKAREYFREIVDTYPQSTYRADAKLGVGDCYLGENSVESRILALNEFREFLTYFPTHPRADYAQYKLGLAHFSQMLDPQRDQTETREAIKEFETFLELYPNSEYTGEVRTKLRAAKDRLDLSDYRVGLFYYRVKWYPGAIDRFRAILNRDPEFSQRDAVYYYLGESLIKVQRSAEALPYFERLVAEFEKSEYLEAAKRRIAELKTDHVS